MQCAIVGSNLNELDDIGKVVAGFAIHVMTSHALHSLGRQKPISI